jgi:hypothetical protein
MSAGAAFAPLGAQRWTCWMVLPVAGAPVGALADPLPDPVAGAAATAALPGAADPACSAVGCASFDLHATVATRLASTTAIKRDMQHSWRFDIEPSPYLGSPSASVATSRRSARERSMLILRMRGERRSLGRAPGGRDPDVARHHEVVCHTAVVLVTSHLSIAGAHRGRRVTTPDLALLDDVVAPKVLAAKDVASKALTALRVRHVLVGGLAVGANGYPHATKTVDFLVGDEAFEHHPAGYVAMKSGVPIQVNGIAIDLRSVQADEDHLATALEAPMGSIIEAPQLVYLKLKSPRQKDRVDVIELIKAGINIEACRTYMIRHAPALTSAFEDSVAKAAAEE